MVVETNFYDILSVSSDATTEEIARAYKRQALKCHPDKTNHNPQLTEMFKEMTRAYETLRDTKTRNVYDAYGEAGLDTSFQPPPPSQPQTHAANLGLRRNCPSNVFSQVFNDINNMFSRESMFDFPKMAPQNLKKRVLPAGSPLDQEYVRGVDIHHTCNVTLGDLYYGKTIKLQLPKNSKCRKCLGVGGFNPHTCRQCQGLGQVCVTYYNLFSEYRQFGSCDPCNGSGIYFSSKDRCLCNVGYLKEKKIIRVNVLPGTKNGDKIILQGEADEGRNVVPGDVIIHLREITHPFLVRKFNDLYMEHEIDLRTALLGGEIMVADFLKSGQTLKVYINVHGYKQLHDSDSVRHGDIVGTINTGKPKLVRGLGMPINEIVSGGEVVQNLSEVDEMREVSFDLKRYKRGNLFINFNIKMPSLDDFRDTASDLAMLELILPRQQPTVAPSADVMEAHLSNLQPSPVASPRFAEPSSDYNYDDIHLGEVLADEADDEKYYEATWNNEHKRRRPNDPDHELGHDHGEIHL